MVQTSPSSLITLDSPVPKLTLLDCEDSEEEQCGPEARTAAPKLVSRPVEPVSLLESYLIDLADGSTIVFRPARQSNPANNLESKVARRDPKSSRLRRLARPRVVQRPVSNNQNARAHLVELAGNDSTSVFTSPARRTTPYSSVSCTPDLTPATSFSSRASSPESNPLIIIGDRPILFSTPQEVVSLFKLDAISYPFPDTTIYRSSDSSAKLSEIEKLVDVGDEDMIDEVVRDPTGFIYAQEPETSSATILEVEDEEQLVDFGSSDTPHRLTREVSPSPQHDSHQDDLAPSHHFGLNPPPSPYALYSSQLSPRLGTPNSLLNPSPPDPLQTTILQSWAGAEPSQANKDYLANFLENLSVIINSALGGPGVETLKGRRRFELDVFGSVSWGGTTGLSGDLDLVLLVSLSIR